MSATEEPVAPSSTPLPPGMVLGPDGKPCRTCTDWKSWSKLAKTKKATTKENEGRSGSGAKEESAPSTTAAAAAAATTTTATTTTAGAKDAATDPYQDCPPDREVLGRATWTFLHTMAAYYPDKPSQREQETMKTLLSSFSQFYPCGHCAEHLREEMKKDPPKVSSRMELAWWMCGMHNKVNVMLGKDEFDCNKLDERWRDGPSDGRCD
ncbi:hypothetical protein BGW41_004883 [Actinomortierella wolfii]|nr:hypothetical protein BGW41_004883 [Actinomortierella wolfii]